ncbi:MAG: twin-arginine translocase TatA/TatE family subunit [Kiritimatiellia bacterium]|nr:twin-arginine translocase TatA/TatE family subunit [Lentisphaerota bacterium]
MVILSACHPVVVSPVITGGMAFVGGTLGGGELLVVLLVLLLLFGARRLPELARAFGRSMEEFRRATRGLSHDLMDEPSVSPRADPSTNPEQQAPPEPPEYQG